MGLLPVSAKTVVCMQETKGKLVTAFSFSISKDRITTPQDHKLTSSDACLCGLTSWHQQVSSVEDLDSDRNPPVRLLIFSLDLGQGKNPETLRGETCFAGGSLGPVEPKRKGGCGR